MALAAFILNKACKDVVRSIDSLSLKMNRLSAQAKAYLADFYKESKAKRSKMQDNLSISNLSHIATTIKTIESQFDDLLALVAWPEPSQKSTTNKISKKKPLFNISNSSIHSRSPSINKFESHRSDIVAEYDKPVPLSFPEDRMICDDHSCNQDSFEEGKKEEIKSDSLVKG